MIRPALMTAAQFKAAQRRTGWTNARAAEELGVSLRTIEAMRQGTRPVTATVALLLKCKTR